MCRHDIFATIDYYWNGCSRNDGDPFPSVSFISVRETDTEVHTISWEGASFGSVWSSCNLLPEKCQSADRKPWNTGGSFNSSGDHTAFMEKTDAAFHSGRNGMLYAFGAVCFLKKMSCGIFFLQSLHILYMIIDRYTTDGNRH